MTSSDISSSSAQKLHSGIHHVNLASFVFGSYCAPLPKPAALSAYLKISHIFITGDERPSHECFVWSLEELFVWSLDELFDAVGKAKQKQDAREKFPIQKALNYGDIPQAA